MKSKERVISITSVIIIYSYLCIKCVGDSYPEGFHSSINPFCLGPPDLEDPELGPPDLEDPEL